MKALMALVVFVLGVCLAAGGLPSGGFWWDFLAALGYCAFALIAFMGWDSESPGRNPRLRQHRNLAVLATVVALAHSIGYLLQDSTLLEYLMPAAPAYMLLGILALLLLIGTTYSSLPGPRQRTYPAFSAFRRWHRALFLLLLLTTGWHVFGTEFSLSHPWQVAILVALLGGAPLLAYLARRFNRTTFLPPGPADAQAADLHPLLSGLAMLMLSASFAGLKVFACDA